MDDNLIDFDDIDFINTFNTSIREYRNGIGGHLQEFIFEILIIDILKEKVFHELNKSTVEKHKELVDITIEDKFNYTDIELEYLFENFNSKSKNPVNIIDLKNYNRKNQEIDDEPFFKFTDDLFRQIILKELKQNVPFQTLFLTDPNSVFDLIDNYYTNAPEDLYRERMNELFISLKDIIKTYIKNGEKKLEPRNVAGIIGVKRKFEDMGVPGVGSDVSPMIGEYVSNKKQYKTPSYIKGGNKKSLKRKGKKNTNKFKNKQNKRKLTLKRKNKKNIKKTSKK
jgi:hypothetical protein